MRKIRSHGVYAYSTEKKIQFALYLVLSGLLVAVLLFFMLKSSSLETKLNVFQEELLAAQQKIGYLSNVMYESEAILKDISGFKQEQEQVFEYQRRNSYHNLLRLAEEFPYRLTARKKVYQVIAENILNASSYGEIIFEMSRLPTEEYQARIMLETDLKMVAPLFERSPAFSFLLHPVRVEGSEPDGRGFRITSDFSDQRVDPFGAGGTSPHLAVDIMNVSNIAGVNYGGELMRINGKPGEIISAADGIVINNNFNEVYGWFVEIEHPLNEEVLESYPKATAYSSFYAHLENASMHLKGTKVLAGVHIGDIGNSGRSTGPHLHYEIRIYHPNGAIFGVNGRYDKINPYK
jgi:murein DD-endopeptidase MepM/ murein hydrolase activator NlpD